VVTESGHRRSDRKKSKRRSQQKRNKEVCVKVAVIHLFSWKYDAELEKRGNGFAFDSFFVALLFWSVFLSFLGNTESL